MASLLKQAINCTTVISRRVFIGATRADATRMAAEWRSQQTGLRQTLRTEWLLAEKGTRHWPA